MKTNIRIDKYATMPNHIHLTAAIERDDDGKRDDGGWETGRCAANGTMWGGKRDGVERKRDDVDIVPYGISSK
jgi:hypothetical protein